MRRREFVRLIGSAAATWPLVARAQQRERMRRVGILLPLDENDLEGQRGVTAFVRELQELGWKEGGNIQYDYRWAGADASRIRSAAFELVDLKPDAILAQTTLTVAPLRQITNNIPIVFLQVADPVGSGFVASLARPGGNITGFSPAEFSMYSKMLEVLKNVAPQVNRVAVFYHPALAPQVGMKRAIETAAPSLGVETIQAGITNAEEITHIIEDFGGEPGRGIVVLPNPATFVNHNLIIALTSRYHLPAVYSAPYNVREGGLVSYGPDPIVQFRQAASYVDRILRGAQPTDLPVQQATKFELVINLKTAKALGLLVPPMLLATADEVIE
jgi:putative ABC transport system substrate-binding protein